MRGFASKFSLFFLLLAAVSSIIVLFPGSYSVDSIIQYDQVVNNSYHDWHSPLLPYLWKVLVSATGKYYSLYIMQMILYWLFIYLLLFKLTSNIYVYMAGVAIAMFSLYIPQYVMKDTHMIIAWGIAGVLTILLHRNTYSFKSRLLLTSIIVLLIIYGTGLRMSNIIAAVILFYMFVDAFKISKAKKIVATLLLCIVTVTCVNYFIYNILHAERKYPEYKLMLLDVTGISKQTGKNYIPAEVQNIGFNREKLYSEYTPASIDDIYWPAGGTAPMFQEPDAKLNTILSKNWLRAIKENPQVYLQNRWQGFLYFLRIHERFAKRDYWDVAIFITDNNANIRAYNSEYIYEVFSLHYYLHQYSIFFAPWLWLLINTVLFLFCSYKYMRTKSAEYRLQGLLQLSGVVLLLSMLLIYQHDRDFRYTYWNYLLAFIGIIHCISLYAIRRIKRASN